MLNPKQRRNVLKIIPFGIIWGIFGLLYVMIEHGILGDSPVYPTTNNSYSFESSLLSIPLGAFAMGLILGGLELLILNTLLKTRPFWQKILYKTVIYLSVITVLLLTVSLIANGITMGKSPLHPEVRQSVVQFMSDFVFVSILLYSGMITTLSLFIAEVVSYLGGGIFNNFFVGKYHRPLQEERIFMFLDMKSSTTIAEQLGHIEYFKLLNQYYADTSEAIIQTSGEVYQYAGDEVIVSWNLATGLNRHNCIRCFFMIKDMFRNKSQDYAGRFGVVPGFKAGLHCGQVTTGEIGVLKKEIFFTGDVLNTTARIQASCNALGVDILISDELRKQIGQSDEFEFTPVGERELRGRQQKANLFAVGSPK